MSTPEKETTVLLPSSQAVHMPGFSALEVGERGLQLEAAPGKADWYCSFAPGWRGLLLLEQVSCHVVAGGAKVKAGELSLLTKMQAFVDEDCRMDRKEKGDPSRCVSLPCNGVAVLSDRRTTEGWFLGQLFRADPSVEPISALLRRLECYSLVRFLLKYANDKENLRSLAERYGLSYTHFRRLCHRALGGSAKAELNTWRLARTLLDLADGDSTATEIALKHGYASSSHFSNDVRGQVGVSPRVLSDILNLAEIK